MPPLYDRLLATNAAAHLGDQLALAALPLTAVVVLGAGPGLVGALVAVQGLAWLVVSLPAGVWVDRFSRGGLIAAGQALACVAFLAAAAAAELGSPIALGVAVFLGSTGAVILVLAAMALVPDLVARDALAKANARLELARALTALGAPALAGLLAQRGMPQMAFLLAALAAAVSAWAATRLRDRAAKTHAARPRLSAAIREGAAFAIRHELLRGIVLCAVCWNFAFFALMAVGVPYALQRIGLDAAAIGLMQSGYGFGLVLGAALAGALVQRCEPRAILIAGPALSTMAAILLLLAPSLGFFAGLAGFFLIGFGPMLWLVCQTGIRQTVTPLDLRGRVTAMIQVAIYGVRPLGALMGGAVGAAFGLDAAMALVAVGFALSLAVPLTSALGRLRAMPEAAAA